MTAAERKAEKGAEGFNSTVPSVECGKLSKMQCIFGSSKNHRFLILFAEKVSSKNVPSIENQRFSSVIENASHLSTFDGTQK